MNNGKQDASPGLPPLCSGWPHMSHARVSLTKKRPGGGGGFNPDATPNLVLAASMKLLGPICIASLNNLSMFLLIASR